MVLRPVQRICSVNLFKRNIRASGTSANIISNKNENHKNEFEFPGIRTVYTKKLKWVSHESYNPIPVFQVLDKEGNIMDPKEGPALEREKAIKMYKTMIQLNQMDIILYESQRQGRISFYMTNYGEEGIQVGSASALAPNDLIYAQYREAGVILYRGMSVREMIDQCYGNKDDKGRGRQMPVHYGSKDINLITISSPLATQMPQAVGSAYALKRIPNNDRIVVCYFGEGAASEGDAHAGFNFATTLQCPVLFFCRNNGYAISTPSTEQFKGDGIAGRAASYGIRVVRVDGTDTLAVYRAVKESREYILKENAPVLIEAMAYRLGHHSTSDDSTAYRALEEINKWSHGQNPIMKFRSFLENKGWWSENDEVSFTKEARQNVLKNMQDAEKIKKPNWREMFDDVYCDLPYSLQNQLKEMEIHLKKYKEHYPVKQYEGES